MIRIMSFNIWGDYFGNPVIEREEGIGRVISVYSPDILSMQEATVNWNKSGLFASLRGEYAFVETDEAPANNFLPLLYKKEKFSLTDSGFLKFPDTPDGSKGATWGVFEEKSSGKKLAVFGTHFWWKYQGERAQDLIRVSNAALITAKAFELIAEYSCPVVGIGDLNSSYPLPTLDYLKAAGWKLMKEEAAESSDVGSHHGDPVRGADGKYHGARTSKDYTESLDHIFYRGEIVPAKFEVVQDQFALDASDHSPIWCEVEI